MINLPEGYQHNPMAPELDLVSRMHGRFKGTGLVMPQAQREIYQNIAESMKVWSEGQRGFPKRIVRPSVCDVGCGVGIGSNILSTEASFVWGIDTNAESISFATQMFGRTPNHIYYSPQVTFDVVDVTDMPREMKKFDYVTCVEVIEHIPADQADTLISFLNRVTKPNGVVFITSPNRNSPNIQDHTPYNEHHCYEATASEMYGYLITKYEHVVVYNKDLVEQELNTIDTPLVFKCEKSI